MENNKDINKQSAPDKNENKKPQKLVSFTRKHLLIAAGMAVFLFAALWIAKAIQINTMQEKQEQQSQALKQKGRQLFKNATQESLKLMAKPYVWAVRNEMMQNNFAQISQYNNDLVKEKNMLEVMVVNEKGIVVSSTNKKNESKNFLTLNSVYFLNADSTVIENRTDSLLIMSSPIMGFNNRLGTLVVRYAFKMPEAFQE